MHKSYLGNILKLQKEAEEYKDTIHKLEKYCVFSFTVNTIFGIIILILLFLQFK